MAAVTLERVKKRYGDTPVLHGIDLQIADGAFVVLVGPSGCGKSTLLRMIAGLEGITSGRISIGDTVVNHVAAKNRDVAMVFQNYALYPHMTVAANMGFALRLKGLPRADIAQHVERAADLLDLRPLLKRTPRELSGGQRQRVAMGRAIVRDPAVFLFDEPLSNLDAKLRVAMRAEIKSLHQRLKTTTVYVTHDQIEAMTMADTIVVMNNGQIEQAGDPLVCYDKPANRFVAEFIGSPSMNLISGRVEGGRFRADALDWPLPPGAVGQEGREVTYGVRPEHLVMDPQGGPATVTLLEPTGSETQLFAQMGPHSLVALLRERVAVAPGDTVRLAVEPAAAHLFCADGRRL